MYRRVHTRYDRPVENGPAEIFRCVCVCECNEPAEAANKLSLAFPIGFVTVPTLRASAASVARINRYGGKPGKPSLVLDKGPELTKRPLGMSRALRPSNRSPRADALQVFETDSSLGFNGLGYEPLGDYVVRVALVAALPLRQLLQVALGAFRSCLLKPGADALVSPARPFNLFGGVNLTIGVGGNIDHSKINAYPVFGSARRRFLNIHGGEQVPLFVPVDEVGFALAKLQKLSGSLAAYKRDGLPTSDGPDRDLRVVPAEDAVIIGNRSQRLERALAPLVELVGIGNLGDGADYHLRSEAGGLSHAVVSELVDPVLPKRAMLPCYIAYLVSRSVGRTKRLFKRVSLFPSRNEFHLDSELHVWIMPQIIKYRKMLKCRVFLRSLKEVVSNPAIL